MQTIYYTTASFIRHTGNVVDLEDYRRKLALTQEGSLAPRLEESEPAEWEEESTAPAHRRNSSLRARRALRLDCVASLCVILMTAAFTLRVLLF